MQYIRTRSFEGIFTSGEAACLELIVPHQGQLNRIAVQQLDGDLEGFTYSLLDRADACQGTTVSSSNPDDPFLHEYVKSHQLIGLTTADAGEEQLISDGLMLYYENRDEVPSNGLRNNKLYVEITPAGSGDKRFLVVVTVVRE